jgi:D-alanine-D-alanine ligase
VKARDAKVLILNHLALAGSTSRAFAESDAAVLEQVRYLEAVLTRLRIEHRTAAVGKLRDLVDILADSPETIVFNLVEDWPDRNRDVHCVPAVCQAFGKEATGADTVCLALAQDKWRTRDVLAAAGIDIPCGAVVPVGAKLDPSRLPEGRCIVKPRFNHASEGIYADSVADCGGSALARAVGRVHEDLGMPAVVEQFVGEREVTVSLIARGAVARVLAIAEIDYADFPEGMARITDYEAKWIPDSFGYTHTQRIVPARLPRRLANEVRRAAIASWHAVGCRDYARVDMRIDDRGRPWVIDVNPNPDLSPTAGYDEALTVFGMGMDAFVKLVVGNALSRLKSRADCSPPRRLETA